MLSLTMLKPILFFLLSFYVCGVSARPSYSLLDKRSPSASSRASTLEYDTNAKRMAAGLSPRAPTRVFDPAHARRAAASPVAYSGNLIVRTASNNALQGYVRTQLHSSGRLQLTTSASGRLTVSFSFVDSSTFLEVSGTTSSPSHPYIGAAGAALQTNNNNRASVVATKSVPSGSSPQNVGNSSGAGGSESYIWKFNPTTRELTATWINPNGSSVTAYIYYEDSGPNTGLHLSANSNLPGGYTRVRVFVS